MGSSFSCKLLSVTFRNSFRCLFLMFNKVIPISFIYTMQHTCNIGPSLSIITTCHRSELRSRTDYMYAVTSQVRRPAAHEAAPGGHIKLLLVRRRRPRQIRVGKTLSSMACVSKCGSYLCNDKCELILRRFIAQNRPISMILSLFYLLNFPKCAILAFFFTCDQIYFTNSKYA